MRDEPTRSEEFSRDREHVLPTSERPQSRDKLRGTLSTIARCEGLDREGTFRGSVAFNRGDSLGPPAKDLEERFQRDLMVLRQIDGLAPDKWATLGIEGRVAVLREVEARLATSQNRAVYGVYAMNEASLKKAMNREGDDKGFVGAGTYLGETQLTAHDRELYEAVTTRGVFREERARIIWVNEKLLDPGHRDYNRAYDDPRQVLTIAMEEFRHAFQDAALEHPNKHSEVDALALKLWEDGARTYGADTDPKNNDPNRYFTNPLEGDGKTYAIRIVTERYENEKPRTQ